MEQKGDFRVQFADPTLIVLGLSGIAYLVMLIAILRGQIARRGIQMDSGMHDSSSRLLVFYLFISVGFVVIQALLRLQEMRLVAGFDAYTLQRITLYILLAMAGVFYLLTRLFQRRKGLGLHWWAAWMVWIAVAVVLYENPFRLPDVLVPMGANGIIRWLLAFYVVVGGWVFFMIGALLLSVLNYRRATSPLHRNRAMYWSMAVCLAAASGIFFLIRIPAAGNLLHLLALFIAVYAMLTHNLRDLRQALRHSSSYLIMLIVTVAVYTGGFYAIHLIFQYMPGYNPLIAGLALALALAVLFNPLLGVVQRFIAHLITGTRYDAHQTLSEYSMSISNILDIEVLATVVLGLISEAMEISRGALVTVHQETGDGLWPVEGGKYLLRPVSGLGQESSEGRLSANNPVVYYLSREHHPLTQYDIDFQTRFQVMEPEERAWLSSLKMDLYVPIYVKENWIGLLALGPKTSGDRYFDHDMVLLQTLADQTAVALENARLYQDLKLRNTENERLNAELKTANTELARLDQAKSDFINIASHELRTPLTQVIGYNDILGEMIRSDDLQAGVGVQMVDSVRKAARRLEEIVETMFDVSKLDTKTLDLARAPVSLASIISVAVETWAKGMEERHQNMSVRGIANLPTIFADGKRLTQVFSHLIQNAIKSTPDGGQIRISGRVVNQEENTIPASGRTPNNGSGNNNGNGAHEHPPLNRYVEIVVSDTGIGIAPEDLERIFEKFYRVGNVLLHSTGDTKFKGAGPGLGLTIARGIIEAHGGRIWAESAGHDEENCPGARFYVLLPIRTASADTAALTAAMQKRN